jgi:hypothetical protein
LLKCFRKLACTSLHLFEKARVFNCDHGLVRKGIDELDLAFCEWAHFGASDGDHADCFACVDQRDGEHGAITELERQLLALGVFICFGQRICELDRSPVEDGTSYNAATDKG